MKWLAKTVIVAALLAVLAALWGHFSMSHYLSEPLNIEAPYRLNVAPGSTLRTVTRRLRADGVSDNTHWLVLRARLDKNANQIKAGQYTIEAGTTPQQLFEQLIKGAVDLEQVTIIEGWTSAEAIAALIAHEAVVNDLPVIPGQRADGSAWLSVDAQRTLAAHLAIEDAHLEGWFAPDTFRFAAGTSASTLLAQSHRLMQQRLAIVWQRRSEQAPLTTPYELLILASIIEKETRVAAERAEIAGVFARRLKRNMRLQTDPTVIYGIGQRYDGDIRRKDLAEATPYNTYRIDGLPPTPIALPGLAALEAAADPAEGSSLYFVASGNGDGGHIFSATLAEHEAAVRQYLRNLRREPKEARP